jgi:hypothetical protein
VTKKHKTRKVALPLDSLKHIILLIPAIRFVALQKAACSLFHFLYRHLASI